MKRSKNYIDFAHEHGFDEVLIEGWQSGFEGWFGEDSVTVSFTKTTSDFNLEEVQEYAEAARAGDLVEVLDALADIGYILAGTIINHGMQEIYDDAFSEVHRSNMAKLVDGKVIRREDGKVLKPEGWQPPQLASNEFVAHPPFMPLAFKPVAACAAAVKLPSVSLPRLYRYNT